MSPRAVFGLSVLLGLISSSVAAALLVLPALHTLERRPVELNREGIPESGST
jgi:hypothetical protein